MYKSYLLIKFFISSKIDNNININVFCIYVYVCWRVYYRKNYVTFFTSDVMILKKKKKNIVYVVLMIIDTVISVSDMDLMNNDTDRKLE